MNRLLAASEPGGWSRSYGYDQYGNRWVSASSGPPPEVHEPGYETNFDANTNRLYVAGSTFDSAGNQTTFAPWTLSYDAENRNVTVDSATNGNGIFAYDGDGRRVKKTWTPYGGTPTTTYYVYNALGQLAAEYSTQSSTAGTSYVHKDMLGSTRMVTDAAGATVECYDYLPFGRMLSDAVNGRNTGCYPPNPDYQINSKLPQKFTGKERDAETRLDYFGARYYSSAQSRFTSPDPIGIIDQKSVDPQQWNMYAYTRNNPLRFLDPTGMYVTECKEADITKCDEDTQAFEAARQRNLKSKDKKIRQTAEAYGNYGEKGIMVTFLKQDVGGGGSVTFDLDNSGRATGTLTVNFTPEQMAETKKGPFGDTTLDAIIAHEGSHVIDDLKLISGGYRKKDNITHLKGEQNAYSVENKVLQTEIGRTNPDWQSKKAIEAFLKRNPGLYPNLNAPILDPNRIPDKAKK